MTVSLVAPSSSSRHRTPIPVISTVSTDSSLPPAVAVTGRVSLTDSFVDATGGDRLRTVVTNVIPAGITLKTGAVDQGSLAGDLLGSVLLLNGQNSEPQSTPDEMNLALDSLRSAGFISYDDGAGQAGSTRRGSHRRQQE